MAAVTNANSKKKFDPKMLYIALGVIGVIALIANLPHEKEKPDPSYYEGPKYNFRNGLFVDGKGKVVPPPPGVRVPEKMEYKNMAKDND